MFTIPPPSNYDLSFSIFGIPVRVHPLFWLIAVLFAIRSPTLTGIVLWVFAMFISILIHELGHAFAMRAYGQSSYIVLHATGGLTVPERVSWGTGFANIARTSNQDILITLAGPGAGFLFAAIIVAAVKIFGGVAYIEPMLGFIPMPVAGFIGGSDIINILIGYLLWINIFWGLINLMPIYPLDGGNVTRHIFLQNDPRGGLEKSLWVSVTAGAVVALGGLLLFQSVYMMFMFGYLAYLSYQMIQHGGGYY